MADSERTRPERAKPERIQAMLDWLNGMPVETQNLIAKKIGTTTGQLRQIAHGNRRCNAQYAVEIDKYSGGKVSMTMLAPDIDWDHVRLFIHAR